MVTLYQSAFTAGEVAQYLFSDLDEQEEDDEYKQVVNDADNSDDDVDDLECKVSDLECKVSDLECKVSDLECKVTDVMM